MGGSSSRYRTYDGEALTKVGKESIVLKTDGLRSGDRNFRLFSKDFPLEILLSIFTEFVVIDKLNVRLTCTQAYNKLESLIPADLGIILHRFLYLYLYFRYICTMIFYISS